MNLKMKKAAFSSLLNLLFIIVLSLIGQVLVGEVAAQPDGIGPGKEIRLGMQDNGGAVELGQDDVLVIELESNPSAGYIWVPQGLDQTMLREKRESQFRPESELLGAPARQIFEFEAVAAQSTTLKLVYGRPWERELMQAQAAPAFSISVQGKGPFSPAPVPTSTPTPEAPLAGVAASAGEASSLALPSRFNWCEQGACPPVRDQGSCGSCWAFGTVGPLEAQLKWKDGVFKDLSEQYLVSCNTDGWSCDGGRWAHDYHLSKIPPGEPDAGAVYEGDFPYVAPTVTPNVPCNPPHPHHEKIVSWRYVGPEYGIPSTTAIKEAIYNYGPVAAAVCAETRFSNYTGGIFAQGDSCSGYYGNINHAIILVGWDDSLGIWHLRNSWGPGWGEGGYMRIQYGVANVGYSANYITYAARTYLPDVRRNVGDSGFSTPTPTRVPPSAELVQNGGFESGATVWGQHSSNGYQCIVKDEIAHTGSWSAWLGGDNNADHRVYQTFAVPSWARSARLQFYLYVESQDVDWPYDFFYGELQTASGSPLQSFFQADNTWKDTNWRLITQDWNDFTSHAGQQRRLLFQGTTNSSWFTNFFVDDVSLMVYSGSLPGTSKEQAVELQGDWERERHGIGRKERNGPD